LRQALDRPAFTTDIIVGFPGETEQDFQETMQVAREVGFAKIHVFSYSPRAGTPAAAFAGVMPPPVIAGLNIRVRSFKLIGFIEDSLCGPGDLDHHSAGAPREGKIAQLPKISLEAGE